MAVVCLFCYCVGVLGIVSCGGKLVYEGKKKVALDSSNVAVAVAEAIEKGEKVNLPQQIIKKVEPEKPKIVSEEDIRKAVFDTAYYYAKIVREKGGSNVHWGIRRFNRLLQIPLNSPYCSSFGIYCWNANGIKIPKTDGRAYSWRVKSRMVWHRGLLAIDDNLWPRLKIFDAIVYTWSHVGFVAPVSEKSTIVNYSKRGITVIGANTTGGVKRVEGVYYPIYRSMNYVFGIYDHFSPVYEADPIGVSNKFLIKTNSI